MNCERCEGELVFLGSTEDGAGEYMCKRCGRKAIVTLGERRVDDSFKPAGVG